MIPLFKSSWSLGKSILTFEPKGERSDRSIIDLCLENGINEIPLIEDSISGIKQCYYESQKNDLTIRFGYRLNCTDDLEDLGKGGHKIVLFLKNKKSWADFLPFYNKINSKFRFKKEAYTSIELLKEYWTDNFKLVIPHYDNFLYENITSDNKFIIDFGDLNPSFILENNNHILDSSIKDLIVNYCNSNSYEYYEGKSIFYNKRSDFDAWQTLKLLTKRDQWRNSSLNVPNMDFCSSKEFCLESYLENVKN